MCKELTKTIKLQNVHNTIEETETNLEVLMPEFFKGIYKIPRLAHIRIYKFTGLGFLTRLPFYRIILLNVLRQYVSVRFSDRLMGYMLLHV